MITSRLNCADRLILCHNVRGCLMAGSYEAATFWVAAATAVVTLGVGAAGALIDLRSAPKRRIFFRMSDPVALLTPDGARHGLQVRRGDEELTDPHLVEVTLQSSGRQSITRNLFDEGHPIVLNLGTRVVDLLKVTSEPTEQAVPNYKVSNRAIEVGPGVLASRQSITFSVLIDGKPKLSPVSPLADVKIGRQQTAPEQKAWRVSYVLMGMTVIALFLFLSLTRFFAVATPVATPVASTPKQQFYQGSGPLPTFGKTEAIAYKMLPSFGFNPVKAQYRCLAVLWNLESGWNYQASNPSGAYGIPQALPGSKMASAGLDWQKNPTTQIKWGLGYIKAVYGDPCAAWAHWQANGFY